MEETMKKLSKIFALLLMLSLALSLFACTSGDGTEPCDECVDEDTDGFCDVCDELVEMYSHTCYDKKPQDGKCDKCGEKVACKTHKNNNEDRKCDVCKKTIPVCDECVDKNESGRCDVCGSIVECDTHVDDDDDDVCDICGEDMDVRHDCIDENPKNAECDICGEAMACREHTDANTDYRCDVCGSDLETPCTTHVNANEDRRCDTCNTVLPVCATCVDANKNNKCDVCGSTVPCEVHVNANEDRKCDACDATIPVCDECVDANKNAKCDVCGSKVLCETCVDANKDAKCDVCGSKVACTECEDDDEDGYCGVCGEMIPCDECVDSDEDNFCDRCGQKMPELSTVVLVDETVQFQFVLGTGLNATVRKVVEQNIIKGIERKSGLIVTAVSEGSSADKEMEYEVLVGDVTNRGEEYLYDRYTLGKKGYVIKVIGTKIIINAGSDATLEDALMEFAEDILNYEDKRLEYAVMTEKQNVEKIQNNYKVTSLSLNGTDMRGFKIGADLTNEDYKNAAYSLQDTIYDRTGYWLKVVPIENATENAIVIEHIAKVYGEESFKVYVDGSIMYINCAFDNKLTDASTTFVLNNISNASGDVNFEGTLFTQDISVVYYEDFGAKGDGKTDDFEAIYRAHVFANISGQTVKATPKKSYYIHNTKIKLEGDANAVVRTVPIKTNTVWTGAEFIIDDSDISVFKGTDTYDLYSTNIFTVLPDDEHVTFTIKDEAVLSALAGTINRSTTEIHIPKDALQGWEGDIMIIPYNSGHKVYRRRGYGGYLGGSMHEVIVIDKDGKVSDETPIMYDYTSLDYIEVYRLDESTAITIEGGTAVTRVSTVNCVYVNANGETVSNGAYINRGLKVSRSFTLVKGVKHKIVGEISLNEQVDASGNIIRTAAAYHGFFAGDNANHITFEDCELMGRRCFPRPEGGTQGTYDLTGNEVNKIVFKNCTQTNFWVTVDNDGYVVSADVNTPGALPSMASYNVNGRNLKMHWGIGGTNYCKNMEYIGSQLSRFDAHAGLYNGKVIDSIVNYLAITGNGDFFVENVTYYAEGTGYGSNSLFHLRSDYGSTWEGNIYLKNVDAYAYTSENIYLFYHSYQNWYFGYQACFPSISIDNLNYYDIKTFKPLPAGYEIYLVGSHVSSTAKLHLPESHNYAVFSVDDKDPDGLCDTCHKQLRTAKACAKCEDLVDGFCDYCDRDMSIPRCESCVDANLDKTCDVCHTAFVTLNACSACVNTDGDNYCDVCQKDIHVDKCSSCKDKGNGFIDEPAMDRDLDGVIDPPIDLDGNGIAGNTSFSYQEALKSPSYDSGVVSTVKINLNMIRPPEFIKILNNDGHDGNGGYVYVVNNTGANANDPVKRVSNGGYWGVEENWGGFFGSTKFYYSETEYFQGPNNPDQTKTTTFAFR